MFCSLSCNAKSMSSGICILTCLRFICNNWPKSYSICFLTCLRLICSFLCNAKSVSYGQTPKRNTLKYLFPLFCVSAVSRAVLQVDEFWHLHRLVLQIDLQFLGWSVELCQWPALLAAGILLNESWLCFVNHWFSDSYWPSDDFLLLNLFCDFIGHGIHII